MRKNEQKANRCKECGYRIRGSNHENGLHHKGHRDLTYRHDAKRKKDIEKS